MTSHNPNDVIHGWCGNCNEQTQPCLVEHMIEKQIIPQIAAMGRSGVDTFFVSTDPDTEGGIEVTCISCGRTARMFGLTEADVSERVVLCPDCIPSG
jgi:hypothetical protein